MPDIQPLILHRMGGTSNPWKVTIILEELGLPYTVEEHAPANMAELKQKPFTNLNPNGRVPSGAIIDYLIEVYDSSNLLHYESAPEKFQTRCWEHFQMSGQGPYWSQMTWFYMKHHEKLPSAMERYKNEVLRTISVIDTHLSEKKTDYLVGNKATYADLMFVTHCTAFAIIFASELDLTTLRYYNAWVDRLQARPMTNKVMAEFKEMIMAQIAKTGE
ncbi:hypothetical protein FOVSG1_006545 [Fusarium oxysporum f. sp. vasinfectum]